VSNSYGIINITFLKPSVGLSIKGIVHRYDGINIVVGAKIKFNDLVASTNRRGIYFIDGVPIGSYGTLTCTHPNYPFASKTILPFFKDLVVNFEEI